MTAVKIANRRASLFAALLLAFALALCISASAAGAVVFDLVSMSKSAVSPGGSQTYLVEVINADRVNGVDGSEVKFTATFPAGITPVSAFADNGSFNCGVAAPMVTCTLVAPIYFGPNGAQTIHITADVDPAAAGVLTTVFHIQGGGATAAADTVDPVRVSALETEFGIDAFDSTLLDANRNLLTQAGAHPTLMTTSIDFNTDSDPNPVVGEPRTVEDVRDLTVDLPAGLVGSVAGLSTCTPLELANASGATNPQPLCPSASQVGVARVRSTGIVLGPLAVYNMVPPPGVPARFGFTVSGTLVMLDAVLRHAGDEYRLGVRSADVLQGLSVIGSTVEFWGVPSDSSHDDQRGCPGELIPAGGGQTCKSNAPPRAFFRTPTSCTGKGLPTSVAVDSWQDPGDFKSATSVSHDFPGYPYAPQDQGPEVSTTGCDAVPFDPSLSVDATTDRADSPTGLSVDLGLPADCWDPKASAEEVEQAICQADLKKAEVTLPEGLTLNAAAAGGREGCSPEQIGLTSPVGQDSAVFDEAAVSCPDGSKLGEVTIATPLLDDTLHGALYLAAQGSNPFGGLLATYLVAEGPGIRIKLAGEISLDQSTGRVTTSFDNTPQLPFANLHLELFGGPRAALRTPAACGTYTTEATLTPWSGNPAAQRQSSFQINQGCGGGFDPKLSAGTENPLAGTYSPFNLRLTREDGMQEFGSLQVSLPPGLVSSLRGYTYCPDSVLTGISADLGTGRGQEASPSCPASSFVGTTTVGAGAGPNPFYTSSGRAYLAGPYKNAPVSLAVVAPAVAGPFDLGSVVVRNPVYVDPRTAQLTLRSDSLPTILHGVSLDLRDIRVHYNHTLNPTNCDPMRVASTVVSAQGSTASPSVHFQAAGCDRLGFKPKLSLRLSGPTHRAAHPGLHAVLRARPGDANIGSATVLLPKTELLENAHIRTICTRVQFNAGAGGGAGCPKGSVYGYAKAWSPLLDQPLQGPVYLRSNGGERELPDLVAALDGQIHVDLVGYIDAVHARIRNRFAIVPDAPVTKFELTMQGGRKGLLANNTDVCKAKPRATVHFGAQNAKIRDVRPLVKAKCRKGARRR
jgi:hypothetical protein